jgi:hypothetical protein
LSSFIDNSSSEKSNEKVKEKFSTAKKESEKEKNLKIDEA